MSRKQRVISEEKSVYGIGTVDEGNWFAANVTGNKGRSYGLLEMPLNLLPSALAKRAAKGQRIHIRLNISEDGETRVTENEDYQMKYVE